MREILFRGKRVDNGKWIYGNYCYAELIDKSGYEHVIIEQPAEGETQRVIPESVGQYTGLTDKNGTKIFEGDIISIPFEEDRSPWEKNCIYYENGEVYFCAEHHGWYVRFYDYDTLSLWEYDDLDIEVIGNIHDNPELLKEREKNA